MKATKRIYKGREIEIEQLDDETWIACAQDSNGVMVVTRPGLHHMMPVLWERTDLNQNLPTNELIVQFASTGPT